MTSPQVLGSVLLACTSLVQMVYAIHHTFNSALFAILPDTPLIGGSATGREKELLSLLIRNRRRPFVSMLDSAGDLPRVLIPLIGHPEGSTLRTLKELNPIFLVELL